MNNQVEKRKQRIRELEALIARPEKLSNDEYLSLLHEIRKNYTAKLAVLSVQSLTTSSGATMNVIDKVHWLIDSIESKDIEKPKDDNFNVNIFFKHTDEGDTQQ